MSITQSMVYKISSKNNTPLPRFQPFFNPISEIRIRKHGDKSLCSTNRSIRYLIWQHDPKVKRKFVVCSGSVPPEPPASSGGLPGGIPGSWKGWLLGIVVTVIIPLMTNKWGALLKWTRKDEEKLESTVQTVEDMVEAVEDIAEKVDKFAEEISDDLPEGKLKETLERIENVAERVAKDADRLDDMIDKVQEAEDKLEAYIEEEQRNSAAKKDKNGKKI